MKYILLEVHQSSPNYIPEFEKIYVLPDKIITLSKFQACGGVAVPVTLSDAVCVDAPEFLPVEHYAYGSLPLELPTNVTYLDNSDDLNHMVGNAVCISITPTHRQAAKAYEKANISYLRDNYEQNYRYYNEFPECAWY